MDLRLWLYLQNETKKKPVNQKNVSVTPSKLDEAEVDIQSRFSVDVDSYRIGKTFYHILMVPTQKTAPDVFFFTEAENKLYP